MTRPTWYPCPVVLGRLESDVVSKLGLQDELGAPLSWADLIALAGTVAVEKASGKSLPFCGGRTDAADGEGSVDLEPKISGAFVETAAQLKGAAK